jgi:SAM-dependent methyltransferase
MTDQRESDQKSASIGGFVLDPSDPAHAGQAVYTPSTLRAYDTMIVRLSNSYVWRCPARRILEHYDRHVGASHLDVGPGTGYYLDRCRFPAQMPRITLLDPNPEVLRFAGARLRRYEPTQHAADALRTIDLAPRSFESVGISYVLHCLPGGMRAKAAVFDNVLPLVGPRGVVFGATILDADVDHTRLGRTLMRVYNRKGIFSNVGDDAEGLERELVRRFVDYQLEIVGSVALFAGWVG